MFAKLVLKPKFMNLDMVTIATSYSSLSGAPFAHYSPSPIAVTQDAVTGDVKNQHEERDGDVVKGYYTLVQPDGVTRTVHYTADSHNGFNAEVEYKGEPIVQKAVVTKTIVAAAPVYKAYHH
ncbi:PREDICTED: larval cuticle protein A2B-like [Nicrophorus vespilloides]|uniref:Larval cuticle protein A2B-like n=1 Tax=Nicrophorus vespilloides TaxID=110193 RepID=A0ABM1MQS9_NICVS|nr:PREDICTED: larval cuticle protein A2B-like [Nicrophorus vespilloides]